MFRKRFLFNIIGYKNNVDKASVEIKNIIFNLTNKPADIIMEDKSTIYYKINKDLYNDKCYINKYYLDYNKNITLHSNKIVDLSRHIRIVSKELVQPWNLYVEEVDSLYVNEFMKTCSQINSVYPLNALNDVKKERIKIYLE
jgi:hypothetical protein